MPAVDLIRLEIETNGEVHQTSRLRLVSPRILGFDDISNPDPNNLKSPTFSLFSGKLPCELCTYSNPVQRNLVLSII